MGLLQHQGVEWIYAEPVEGPEFQPINTHVRACCQLASGSELVTISDTLADRRVADHFDPGQNPHLRFFAGVSLTSSRGIVVGTLCVLDRLARWLTSRQGHALHLLARLAVTQIALNHQATRDALTGLLNRRVMVEALKSDLQRAGCSQQPLSVMMIDVDYFKYFNDQFGHALGDEVLAEVAGLLANSVRKGDAACRFGGEEFVLILPGVTPEAALRRALRLCERTKLLKLRRAGRPLGTVTISVGVVTLDCGAQSADRVLQLADAAPYRAKQLGRDRVVATDLTLHRPLPPAHRHALERRQTVFMA